MSKWVKLCAFVYFIIQLFYFLFGQVPFHNDSLRYFETALDCVNAQTLYPGPQNINDPYINAPVFINVLILLLKIWPSSQAIIILNIILNCLQLILLYTISLQLFDNKNYANIVAILYICYLPSLGLVLLNLTELLFGVFSLLSVYFFLKEGSKSGILSGVFLALTIGIRPNGFALFLAFLTIFFIYNNKRNVLKMVYIVASIVITLLVVGLLIKHSYGRFLFMPDTGAVNFIMGANDEATGAYNNKVFEKGRIGHIENEGDIVHFEKAKFWNHQAAKWVKKNPWKWLSLFPNKLIYVFAWDDWSIYVLSHTDFWNLQVIGKMVLQKKAINIFKNEPLFFKVSFILIYAIHHTYYYIILFCMIYQFYYYKKNNKKHIVLKCSLFYFYSAYSVFMILFAVGLARYKYPYFITMLITIAPMVDDCINHKKRLGRSHVKSEAVFG